MNYNSFAIIFICTWLILSDIPTFELIIQTVCSFKENSENITYNCSKHYNIFYIIIKFVSSFLLLSKSVNKIILYLHIRHVFYYTFDHIHIFVNNSNWTRIYIYNLKDLLQIRKLISNNGQTIINTACSLDYHPKFANNFQYYVFLFIRFLLECNIFRKYLSMKKNADI